MQLSHYDSVRPAPLYTWTIILYFRPDNYMDCPTVITEKVQTKAERQMVSGTFSSPITCQIPFQCRQTSVKCYTRYRAESTVTRGLVSWLEAKEGLRSCKEVRRTQRNVKTVKLVRLGAGGGVPTLLVRAIELLPVVECTHQY